MATPSRPQSPFRTRPPANGRVGYDVRAAGGTDAEILLYDEIGFFGVSADQFVRDLKGINAGTIHVRICSPGGDVFAGTAIETALREHPAHIVTHNDALAASISSVIYLAGDERYMAPSAMLMIHDPFALTMGTAAELRKTATVLDKIGANILGTYMQRSGESAETVQAWMADETWFTADEAVDAGFATAVTASQRESKLAASFDLSIFQHLPDALKQQPSEPPHTRRTDKIAAGEKPTIRDIERGLRDVGLTRSQAEAFAALGFPALAQRDAAGQADPALLAVVERLTAAFQLA